MLVETVYSWPGLGVYAIDSIASLDYTATMAVALVLSIVFVMVNLFVDILYGLIDPRDPGNRHRDTDREVRPPEALRNTGRVFHSIWRKPEGKVSLVLLALLVFLCIFGDALAPYPPLKLDLRSRFQPPSREHWFATDEVGRDVLEPCHVGSEGVPGRGRGGYRTRRDRHSPRPDQHLREKQTRLSCAVTDIFLGFPAMLLALAVAAALGPGLLKAMVASSLVWWPGYARLARGQVLALNALPLVESVGRWECRIIRSFSAISSVT